MKELLQKYKKALLSGAVCLVLALALAAGSWAALSAPRQQPETPQARSYPGLNIDQIGLRYDQQSQTKDSAAGSGEGEDGQAPQDDAQQEPETPPEPETPQEPDTPQEPETPPEPETPEEPDPDPQEPDDKTDDNGDGPVEPEQPGDGDGDGPVDPEQPADPEQPQEPQIATDLRNRTIRQEELESDMFAFKAMVVNGDEDTYLRVRVNGKWVTATGDDYLTKLQLGRNDITLLLKRGSQTLSRVDYVINYQAAKADEDDPTKGANPPTIRTNLSSEVIETTNRNLTFTVWAEDWQGNPLNQNHVSVTMDGQVVRQSTGSGANGLEYDLFLDTGLGGDETEHDVTITAWDDDGNSTYQRYKIIYKVRDEGEKIGTATVRLDLSVLGLGVVDTVMDCDVFQDKPASYVVMAALEYLGYEVSFDGTLDSNFYLTRISRTSAFNGAAIPDELKQLLELDGLTIKAPRPSAARDSVGEFDYTMGSGWMYSINGSTYPGRGLSGYFLGDGDVLTLRFTLAYGKDIGGSTGGGTGPLTKYCGTWIDGVYTPRHTYQDGKCSICGAVDPNHTHSETESVTKAATCTEPGEKTYTCSLCGESHTETIPATGHHYENGVCTGCGQSDPAIKPEPTPDPEPEPEPEPNPDPEPEPGGEETQHDETA